MAEETPRRNCRACLNPDETELFDWNAEEFRAGLNYAHCFQQCTQLELSLALPQMLCYDCAFELRVAYSFIKRARRADQKLRSCVPCKREETEAKHTDDNIVALENQYEPATKHEVLERFYDEEYWLDADDARCTEAIQPDRHFCEICEKCYKEQHLKLNSGQPSWVRIQCNSAYKYSRKRLSAYKCHEYKKPPENKNGKHYETSQNIDRLAGSYSETTQHDNKVKKLREVGVQCTDEAIVNSAEAIQIKDEANCDDDGSLLDTDDAEMNMAHSNKTNKNNFKINQHDDEIILKGQEKRPRGDDNYLTILANDEAMPHNKRGARVQENSEALHVEICETEYWQGEGGEYAVRFEGSELIEERIATGENERGQPLEDEKVSSNKSLENKSRRFKCYICMKSLGSSASLGYHLNSAHKGKKLSCTQCSRSFKTPSQLHWHRKTHDKNDRPASEGNDSSEEEERPPQNVETPELVNELDQTDTKTQLHDHQRKVHTQPKWFCKICSRAFKTSYSFRRHTATHNSTTKPQTQEEANDELSKQEHYLCNICNKTYPSKLSLHSHATKVHAERTWLCDICSLAFKTESNLRRHQITHEDRERKFVCSVCGTKCLSKGILKNHMAIHEKNRKPQYACDECDKTFYVKTGLIWHKRFHAGETVACELCQRPFARACDLKVHMRTHTDEKPYKCTQCEASFKVISAYNVHLLMHQGYSEKCHHCGKVFTNASSLQKHKAKHKGEVYKCSICSKGFYARSKLRRHILNVHKVATTAEANQYIVDTKLGRSFTPRIRRVLEDV